MFIKEIKSKNPPTFKVEMELTKGQLIALKNALAAYQTSVGQDNELALNLAIHKANIDLN